MCYKKEETEYEKKLREEHNKRFEKEFMDHFVSPKPEADRPEQIPAVVRSNQALVKNKDGLYPCPFCGHEQIDIERIGTNRASCILRCANCGCILESNEEGYGEFWNMRA